MTFGILGAMPEEIALLKSQLAISSRQHHGMREYLIGKLHGKKVVLAFSRWGKVAAASSATTLIERFGVDMLLFTGVAGGVCKKLNLGDVVVATALVQHDLDASTIPEIRRFEVPGLG